MDLGLLIGMATLGFGGTVLEKTMNKSGKIDEAQYISISANSMIAVTTVACVVKLLGSIKSLMQ